LRGGRVILIVVGLLGFCLSGYAVWIGFQAFRTQAPAEEKRTDDKSPFGPSDSPSVSPLRKLDPDNPTVEAATGRTNVTAKPWAPVPKKRTTSAANETRSIAQAPPTFDMAEAQATVRALWNVWITSSDGRTPEELSGLVLPPDDWMNDRLAKMGRPYRVKANGAQFNIYAARASAQDAK
ncbi:MAG: hypothetical protein ACXWJC_08585, partial [Croceibacterium sp.]